VRPASLRSSAAEIVTLERRSGLGSFMKLKFNATPIDTWALFQAVPVSASDPCKTAPPGMKFICRRLPLCPFLLSCGDIGLCHWIVAQLNAGEFSAAVETFTEILAAHPRDSLVYRLRGNAYGNLGDRKKARYRDGMGQAGRAALPCRP
jgi:hypothetical protein